MLAAPPSFHDKLAGHGPRKLLALDGGGIRGLITIEVLAAIESKLQGKLGRADDFVLADYFDYIAGTSTGAIIAACLSLGMRVDKIREFYRASGPLMFSKARWFRRLWHTYDRGPLALKLQETFGADTLLGSERLRTLLMLVLRNATTDSPWPVCSNPAAKYNNPATRPGCNLQLPLWQLVRASTAAPVYFPPEEIEIHGHTHQFVDGGVTMFNNPAFQLFLMATAEPYHLCWETGEKKLLLISIGTGSGANAHAKLSPRELHLLYNARSIPAALMFAALNEQDVLCRMFGACRSGDWLDRELEDLIGKRGPVTPKLFTYARYNADLSRDGLNQLGLSAIEPAHVQQLDSCKYRDELGEVGRAASKKVAIDDFEDFV